MNIAIILAGGSGTRIGADCPKQFIDVLGKPVIAYTMQIFQSHELIDLIEVVCVKDYEERLQQIITREGLTKARLIVQGGEDFQHSVMNGVRGLKSVAKPDDIVLVHYAASPFTTPDIITDCIRVAREHGNSTSATPCYLLLGQNDDGKQSSRWIDRDRVMQLNTPQCFQYQYICSLYDRAEREGLLSRVEPHTTSLMYLMGETIYFAKGNQINIKITTPEDLQLFEGYALLQQQQHT